MMTVIIATIILIVVLKCSYRVNDKCRKELESLEEIF